MRAALAALWLTATSPLAIASGVPAVAAGAPAASTGRAPSSSAGDEGGGTALIAIGDRATIAAALMRLAAAERARGAKVMEADDVSLRLRGVPAACAPEAGKRLCYLPPDEEALARMLADARQLESQFEGDQAAALREQIIDTFKRTPQPSMHQRLLTGQAWLDLAAGLAADGKVSAAEAAARDAMRHFGDTPIEKTRYSPSQQELFLRARAAVDAGPRTEIEVRSTLPGTVFADGRALGRIEGALTAQLPAGEYRLWVQLDGGAFSLPRAVVADGSAIVVDLDPELDARLSFSSPVRLQCTDRECPPLLARLRERLGCDRLIAARAAKDGAPEVAVIEASGEPAALTSAVFTPLDPLTPPLEPETRPAGLGGFLRHHPGSIVSGAIALAAVITGTVFGVQSRSDYAAANDPGASQLRHDELNDSGADKGRLANVFFGVAGAATVTAGVFLAFEW